MKNIMNLFAPYRGWTIVIGALLACNLLLRVVSTLGSTSNLQSKGYYARSQGKYSQASSGSSQTDPYSIMSQIANGDISRFDSLGYEIIPTEHPDLDRLVRASFLLAREQEDAALEILRNTPITDQNVLALSLALRAHIYCENKDFEACYILSQDAKRIDPSSALAHMISSYASRTLKLYNKSQKDLEIVQSLSGTVAGTYQMQRGITSFYARDLDTARTDLLQFVDDPEYSYDALVFLGRTAYDQQDYDAAIDRFEQALVSTQYKNRVPYMRLGRIAMRKDDLVEAEKQYNYAGLLARNNTEFLTDQLYMYDILGRTDITQKLIKTIESSIFESSSAHAVYGRRLRDIGQLEKSEQYLRDGKRFLVDIENEFLRDEVDRSLQVQNATTLMQTLYNNFNTGAISDIPIQAQLDEITSLGLNTRHVDMYSAWSTYIGGDYTASIQQIQEIDNTFGDIEMIALRYWMALGNGNTAQAQEILTLRPDEDPQRSDEIKSIRKKQYTRMAAIGQFYIGDTAVANETLQVLRNDPDRVGPPFDGPETNFRLQRQAYEQFAPWIYWIAPYIEVLN